MTSSKDKARQKKWYQDNKERVLPRMRDGHLQRNYGITSEIKALMKKAQEGHCLICDEKVTKLAVDHDHKSNRLRGLLCELCNRGLGHFKDNPVLLLIATRYLLLWGDLQDHSTASLVLASRNGWRSMLYSDRVTQSINSLIHV